MIERSFDAERMNAVFNDPAVFPLVAFDGCERIDIGPLVEDRNNVLLTNEWGGFLFVRQQPSVYHLHTAFLPEGRGREALLAAQQAAEWMFTRTDCLDIVTVSPDDVAASHPPKTLGFVEQFRRENVFTRGGRSIGASFWALRYWDWARRTPGLVEAGHRFHEQLGAQSPESLNHTDDPVHDRYVGAAVLMVAGGQYRKAVMLYNVWARFAGYEPVEVESDVPLIINMAGTFLRHLGGEKFEVVTCPSVQSSAV